jgi:hypothetical protein
MKNLDVLVRQFLDLSFVANLSNQSAERHPEVSSLGPTEQASQAPRIALAQTRPATPTFASVETVWLDL